MSLGKFRYRVVQLWLRALRRRSGKDGVSWKRMTKLAGGLPAETENPSSMASVRFAARHPRVGAGCLNWARPDLCRGRGVTRVPTAKTVRSQRNDAAFSGRITSAFPKLSSLPGRWIGSGREFARRYLVKARQPRASKIGPALSSSNTIRRQPCADPVQKHDPGIDKAQKGLTTEGPLQKQTSLALTSV